MYCKHSCLPHRLPNPLPQFLISLIVGGGRGGQVPQHLYRDQTTIYRSCFSPQYESWGLNSSHQTWQPMTLPLESSQWPYTMDKEGDENQRPWTTRGMTRWVCGFGMLLGCYRYSISLKALERSKHWKALLSRTGAGHVLPSHEY